MIGGLTGGVSSGVSWFWDSVRFDASLRLGSAGNALIRLDRAVRCTLLH